MTLKRAILNRVAIVYFAVLLAGFLIASKVVYLQYIDDDKWKEKAEKTLIKNVKIPSHRGDILADDMRILSSSIPLYDLHMDFKTPYLKKKLFYDNLDSISEGMARIFGDKSKAEYARELDRAYQKGYRYYRLKRKVNYNQLHELTQLPIFRLNRYRSGLVIEQSTVRKRPLNNLAARTIGKTTESETGNIVGLEGGFDSYLAGREGIKKMQKLVGNVWMPLDDANDVEPIEGSSIVTTLNIELQDVTERALHRYLQNNNAHHGTAVLMEVQTGQIKAIANLTRVGDDYLEIYNYAIGESTEPGSTFKVPALMAALEDGAIDITDTIDTGKGYYAYNGIEIKDHDGKGYGKISVAQVLENSSNVGMAKIITSAYESNPHRFVERLYNMKLNTPLNIPIKGEGAPVIHYPNDDFWSGVSLASMSYGYEVRQTPLQILSFYNAIANNGVMVKPLFVKEIRKHGRIERVFHTEIIHPSICSRATLRKTQAMLRGVVENGTATILKQSPLPIAGKTGTAQIYNSAYGYKMGSRVSYQASFVGYFPADKPRYSCIVVVNSPSNTFYTGNMVAGPVFLEIANKIYATNTTLQPPLNKTKIAQAEIPYSKSGDTEETLHALKVLKIPTIENYKNSEWVETNREENTIRLESKKLPQNLMPNVVSMGLKDAIYILENAGLKVKVKGRGSIRQQSIPAGSRIKDGQTVVLEMSFTEGS